MKCCQLESTKKKCGLVSYILVSVPCLLLGLVTLYYTPFEFLMDERIRMTPGLPPYEWWNNPPDKVMMRAFLFNVTNSERFLLKLDAKINVEEIGPLYYMEKLTHTNVTFNANGTMTYVATRKLIFLQDQNHHIDLEAIVVVPNWALLGMASYLSEQSFFVKLGFNLMVRTIKPQPFVRLTINQLLWNFTDPMLDAAQQFAPFLVPMKNLGILSRIYTHFVNTVTVYIGSKHGHQLFSLIDKYDGSEYLPHYGPQCPDKVQNSSEGVTYSQYMTKDTPVKYWRNTLCKNAVLSYEHDVNLYGVNALHFVLPASTFNRTEPSSSDCYRSVAAQSLPDGLSDVSKCHFGFPLAASFPHFLYGSDVLDTFVTGLKPNESEHGSFLTVEPYTGVPLESKAACQSNLVVRRLSGFNSLVMPFSDLVIPMFWLDYKQVGLPWYISAMVYFQVNLLPIGQRFFSAFLLVLGVILLCLYAKARKKQRLLANKVLVFERELFLDKSSTSPEY